MIKPVSQSGFKGCNTSVYDMYHLKYREKRFQVSVAAYLDLIRGVSLASSP